MYFSEKTKEALLDAGWHEERKIDISEYEETLISEGYPLNQKTKDFLTEFGGLEVIHDAYVMPDETDYFHFDPIIAIDNVMRKTINKYEKRIRKSLDVIGEAFSSHMVLMMDYEGKIYGGYDSFLTCLGENFYEAINNLCEGTETEEIE